MAKRIVKLVIGLVLTVAVGIGCFHLRDHLDHFNYEEPGETFVGVLSSSSYSTKEATAKAFMTNELTGASADPVYSGYEVLGELNSAEISNLALTESESASLESAEHIAVHYTCDGKDKTNKACLLKMSGDYYYYVPLSSEGEALTNSYFDSVLDGAKYLNCTSVTTLNMRIINPDATSDATYRQSIMFDNDIAYFDQDLPGIDYDLYFEESNSSIIVYLEHPQKKDGKFYTLPELNRELRSQNLEYRVYLIKGGEQINVSSLSSIQDVTDFMFMMDLDASYFVKTPYGFSMPDEKYQEVCKLMMGDVAYREMIDQWEEHHIHFNADYYVSDGRLSASKIVLTMSNGDDIFALNISVNYTNFGTTEVLLPNSTED